MKKLHSFIKGIRFILHFFPLLRFFFRFLQTLFLLVCSSLLFEVAHKMTKIYLRLAYKNMKDPLTVEFLIYYYNKRKRRPREDWYTYEDVDVRNYGTFNSAFKKECGITPGEWKLKDSALLVRS